jgi:hypothetical protein
MAPQEVRSSSGPWTTGKEPAVAEMKSTVSGSGLKRCTDEYIELLSEDFGIPVWVLASAFMGMPRVRKDVALFVCALAGDMPDPARAVIRWAKLGGRGAWSVAEGGSP